MATMTWINFPAPVKPSELVLNRIARRLLRLVPTRVYEQLIHRDVVGLCYHLVSDAPPAHAAHIVPCKTPQMFEQDLRYLRDNYDVVGYDEVCGMRREGQKGRRPAVVITIDDGYRECFTEIRPLLLKYELPAIFFLTTEFIDNRRLFYRNLVSLCIDSVQRAPEKRQRELLQQLSWQVGRTFSDTLDFVRWVKQLTRHDSEPLKLVSQLLNIDQAKYLEDQRPYLTREEIQHLQSEGFTIGAHSCTHRRLGKDSSSDELKSEITSSCEAIAQLTNRADVPFAFPFSGDDVERNELATIRQERDAVGLIFDRRGFRRDEDFVVHRIIADSQKNALQNSNVPRLIRTEYQSELRAGFRDRFGKRAKHNLASNSNKIRRAALAERQAPVTHTADRS